MRSRFRVPRLPRLARSPLVFWFLVALVALLTASVVARMLGEVEALAARYGPLRPVVVAARPVEAGRQLAPADVTVRQVPESFLPEGAVRDADDVVGRTAVVRLARGQPVLLDHVAPEGLRGVAALLPGGTRAVAVPSGAASAPVQRGDYVDVLATLDEGAAAGLRGPNAVAVADTVRVAADALVVDVGPDAATVAVLPEEARAVAFAVSHGAVTLALTPGPSPRRPAQLTQLPERAPVARSPSTTAPAAIR